MTRLTLKSHPKTETATAFSSDEVVIKTLIKRYVNALKKIKKDKEGFI